MGLLWVFSLVALFVDGHDNVVVAPALSAAIVLAVGWHVAHNTSAPIAVISTLLLAISGAFFAFVLLGLLGLLFGDRKERR